MTHVSKVGDWRYRNNKPVTVVALLPHNRVAYVLGHLDWDVTHEGDLTRTLTTR